MNIQNRMNLIIDNIEKVFFGKRDVVEMLVLTLVCGGHILIEDIPGMGKTTVAESLAKSIDGSYKRIQFTPDVMPSDVTGFSMYNQKTNDFEYYEGAVMSNIILADEINRTSPKTQSSLLEAMEENKVTVDGITYNLPNPFMVIATQNPIEFIGTYPLPEAQLDRFFIKTEIGYPSTKTSKLIMRTYEKSNPLESLSPVVKSHDIIEMQNEAKEIYICDELLDYILRIVNETRNNPDIQLGVSPRGALHLMYAAKVWAAYMGRDYIIPDDIKKFIIPITSHRLVLKNQLIEAKLSTEKILNEIIDKVAVPVIHYDKK